MSRLSEKRKAALESMMKETIHEAAVATLLEHGLEGLTMERVAEAAEMAKGTLYNYFKDKQRLLLSVFVTLAESFNEEMARIVASDLSASEKLVKVLENMFSGFEKNRHILVILAQGRIHNLKEYSSQLAQIPELADSAAVNHPIDSVIRTIIEEGIEQKEFHVGDPVLLTDIVLGAVTSVLDRQVEEKRLRPGGEGIKEVVRFLMAGLRGGSLAV